MTTFGSCCYAECPNSYSTDSDDVFFKFPVEPGRRKKWIDNCGNPELTQLADRQLRGKRVCGRHFLPASFVNPTTKEVLTDKAIPVLYKLSDTPKQGSSASTLVNTDSEEEETAKAPDTGKRGRGRPRTVRSVIPASSIKKEPEEVDDDDEEYEPEGEPPSKGKATPKPANVTPKPAATPVNGTGAGTGRRPGPGRPPALARKTPLVAMKVTEEHEKNIKAAADKVEKVKPEEIPTPGPSGNRMTRRAKEVEKEKESEESKAKVDVPPTPTDFAKTKMGLRKSLVARVAEEEKDKRATRLRAAKSEAEEEPPAKKAKSPTPSAIISRSKSPATSVKFLIKSPPATSAASDIKSALRKGKGDSGEESASDKEVVDTSAKEKNLPVALKKETKTIEKFLAELKTHCVLSEQWTLSGVLWDPGHKMKMIAASEMDVTSSGVMRLKRCIQVFDDMSVKILIDDMTMTDHFDSTKVTGAVDMAQLVSKVSLAKICPGIKTFETQDTTFFPMVTKRGGCWYSADCPIIVDHSIPGPLCASCSRLRSSIRRKKIKEKIDLEKKQSKLLVRVQSKFGRALYTLLTDLMTENTAVVKKPFVPRAPLPQSSTVDNRAGHETDESSREGSRPSAADGKNGTPLNTPKVASVRKIKPKVTPGVNEETPKQQKARAGPRGGRGKAGMATPSGSNSSAANEGQGEGVVEMMEQYVTIEGDNGNLILQPSGGEFTLAEGQEYELIGEADANEPMQVMDPENAHQTIEIIEVDDHTMAQLTGHSVNDMFFQGSENIQVTEIDPNDPNMGQLLKVIDPSQGFTFQ